MLTDILKTEAAGMLLSVVKWTLLGILGGLLLGLGAFFLLRRLGAYRWEGRYGHGLRVLVLILNLVLLPVLLGIMGFNEAVLRSLNHLLLDSDFSRETLPKLGNAGADLFGAISVLGADFSEAGEDFQYDKDELERELEAFRQGDWELNVSEFLTTIEEAGEQIAEKYLPRIKAEIQSRHPAFKEGAAEELLDLFLEGFGNKIREETAATRTGSETGTGGPLAAVLGGLSSEAAREGSPESITHGELSTYLVHQTVRAGILTPTRIYVRGQQTGMGIGVLFVLIVPVVIIQVANCCRRKPGVSDVPE